MKRCFDVFLSLVGLMVIAPIILIGSLLVWLSDFKNPWYIPERVGKNGDIFRLYKIRTMTVGADQNLVDTTTASDSRITSIGKILRRFKIDELPQLLNVLEGSMSLVGPRPNVERETALYSSEEKKILTVLPGITDFSSIVFSNLGEVLRESKDPNLDYNQLIRPFKSALSILYVEKRSILIDVFVLIVTVLIIFSRKTGLSILSHLLLRLDADPAIIRYIRGEERLVPRPPPGFQEIVMSRHAQKKALQ